MPETDTRTLDAARGCLLHLGLLEEAGAQSALFLSQNQADILSPNQYQGLAEDDVQEGASKVSTAISDRGYSFGFIDHSMRCYFSPKPV